MIKLIFAKHNNDPGIIFYILSSTVICLYFFFIIKYAQNIPYWDDYVVTLQFFNDFFNANTISGKADAILAQWSEHRIVIGRLFSLVQYSVLNMLNFKILHVLSNCSLLVLYVTLIRQANVKFQKYLMFPVALLLFHLQYYVASFWFVSSSSMFFVLVFALLSFQAIKKEQYKLSAFCALIAIYSNGNGFLVLLIETAYLLRLKKYSLCLQFASFFIVCVFLYFCNYVPHENDRMATLYFLKDPFPTLIYFLSFTGGCFNIFPYASVIAGITGLSYLSWLVFKKHYQANSSLVLLCLFIAGSALLAAAGRSFWGIDQALESRYKIFSCVLWICLLISFLESMPEINRRIVMPYIIASLLIFNIGSDYKSWTYMVRFLEAQTEDYKEVEAGTPRKNLNEAHDILLVSRANGYYK